MKTMPLRDDDGGLAAAAPVPKVRGGSASMRNAIVFNFRG